MWDSKRGIPRFQTAPGLDLPCTGETRGSCVASLAWSLITPSFAHFICLFDSRLVLLEDILSGFTEVHEQATVMLLATASIFFGLWALWLSPAFTSPVPWSENLPEEIDLLRASGMSEVSHSPSQISGLCTPFFVPHYLPSSISPHHQYSDIIFTSGRHCITLPPLPFLPLSSRHHQCNSLPRLVQPSSLVLPHMPEAATKQIPPDDRKPCLENWPRGPGR